MIQKIMFPVDAFTREKKCLGSLHQDYTTKEVNNFVLSCQKVSSIKWLDVWWHGRQELTSKMK